MSSIRSDAMRSEISDLRRQVVIRKKELEEIQAQFISPNQLSEAKISYLAETSDANRMEFLGLLSKLDSLVEKNKNLSIQIVELEAQIRAEIEKRVQISSEQQKLDFSVNSPKINFLFDSNTFSLHYPPPRDPLQAEFLVFPQKAIDAEKDFSLQKSEASASKAITKRIQTKFSVDSFHLDSLKEEIDFYTQTINQLNKKISSIRAENISLKAKIERGFSEFDGKLPTLNTLDLDVEVKTSQEKLNELRNENSELQESILRFKFLNRDPDLTGLIFGENLANEEKKLTKKIIDLDREIDRLKSSYELEKEKVAREMSARQRELKMVFDLYKRMAKYDEDEEFDKWHL